MLRQVRLFEPLRLRGIEFRNRVFVSPMCQYSSTDGLPNQWHMVHLGSRAVGGVGLVCVEATAVSPEGRISAADTGLWTDEQAEAFAPIVDFVHQQEAIAAIQLAHAGRKASTPPPWEESASTIPVESGGWQTIAPSAIAFADGHQVPREMSVQDIDEVVEQFAASTRRSIAAGFRTIEIHMAHGYLLYQFLSPISNHRNDDYGGSLQNRMRFPLRVAETVRAAMPDDIPLFVRISATDWVDGGWDLDQSVKLCKALKTAGADLIDCSSGGSAPRAAIPVAPGYQVPFAAAIREQVGIPTAAVGLISQAYQAEQILATGQADAVLLARELLRNPYWPLHAARQLGASIEWPRQYDRARD